MNPILSLVCATAVATFCAPALGQLPVSVLDLQKSYHVGVCSGTIGVPTGNLQLLAQSGDLDLLPTGTIAGAFATWESTVSGTTFTPNDPFVGTYHVRPDGVAVFDLDPANPGTELVSLWMAPDGSVFHTARAVADPEALTVLAVEKSTGMSLASLNGSYYFSGQRLDLVAGALATTSSWGVITFNGLGAFTSVETRLAATTSGSTTQMLSYSGSYTVAPDGAITVDGDRGGMSADGQLLFAVKASATSPGVGLNIGVRLGQAYDFANLAGRFSLHSAAYGLGVGPGLPRSTTEFGEYSFTATSPSTGSWSAGGVVVEGSALGVMLNPRVGSGSATIGASGPMLVTTPTGTVELGFAANGRYFVGHASGPATNLHFGVRQCAVAQPYGAGTAGTAGRVPVLGMKTFPVLGNPNWALFVSNGLGGTIGIVPIAFASLSGVPALGGTIYVDPTTVGYIPLVLLGGTPGAPGAGTGATILPLPTTPSLAGQVLFAQGLILDAAAPASFAMTNGFRVELSR